jgi:putative ABC transport system permease protein
MHTDTRITRNQVPPVSPETLWILLAIAGGVLLIACSNFTTLAIGRSASRAREVGIRKVIGGNRRSLAFQFFTDALAFTLVSAMVAFMMATLLLPYMNTLSGRNLEFSVARYPELPWIMGSVIVLTGLLSGAYPAFVLSNFRPVEVLKRKIKVGGSNLLTKSLVSIQFMIAAGLIVSTIIIMQQLRYLQTKSPGFQKENVVVVDATGTDADKIYPFFKQILSGNPAIAGLARADLGLGQGKGYSHS